MSRIAALFLVIFSPLLAICLAWLGLATLPTNPLGWYLLLTGSVYTAGVMLVVGIRRRRFWERSKGAEAVQEERGDRSFWWISLGMIAVFYLSPLEYLYLTAWLPRAAWTKLGGLGLVAAGSLLFVWARRTLGASYSGHVSVDRGQELVQSGPYRLLRHPAYTGYLSIALGIGLGYSSLSGLISVLFLLLPSLVYRINVEEKMLSEHFGEAHRQYARRVKRLIPGIW